jgi:hypothetical protein
LAKKASPIEVERRRFPRLKVPVLIRPAKSDEDPLATRNVGMGGVRIYSNRYLKKGKKLEIEIFFPGGNSVTADVRVVWTKVLPPGSDAVFDVGLEFIALSPAASEQLKTVLESDPA